MSWLGDSFSSITGQLSNFTKEVLYEGREEVSDHATELSLANRKVQDLEAECNKLRTEVSRLRASNGDLEERCRASDLQASALLQQSRDLRAQHKAKQATDEHESNIKTLEIRIEELESQLRDCGERHLQQVSALQDHQEERIRQLHNHYRSLAPSDTPIKEERVFHPDGQDSQEFGDDETALSLKSQLTNVEQQLAESHRKADEQAQLLLEAQRNTQRTARQLQKVQQEKAAVSQDLARLQNSLKSSQLQDETGDHEPKGTDREFVEKSQEENALLQSRIETLEQKLAEREQELLELASEKEGLDSSLVELDGQHQEAMDQLLVVKEELKKDNSLLQQQLNGLQEQNIFLQTEVETLTEQLLLQGRTRTTLSLEEVQNTELASCKDEGGSLSSILQSVSDISSENLELEERIEALERNNQSLEVELLKCKESKELLETAIVQNKEETIRLQDMLEASESAHRTASTELEMLQSSLLASKEESEKLRSKHLDVSEASDYFKKELETLQNNLKQKDKECQALLTEREQILESKFRKELEEVRVETNRERNQLEEQLQKCKEEYDALASFVASNQKEYDSLIEEVKGMKELEQALANTKADREKIETELFESREVRHQLELDFAKNEAEKKQLLSRIAELESIVLERNVPSESSYFGESSQNPDLVAKLQQLTSENENLQNESDDLHVRLMETTGEKERLRVAFEELTDERNEMQGKFEEQRSIVEALELKLEEIEKMHAQGVDKLQQEVESLRSEVQELKLREEVMLTDNKELEEKCKENDHLKVRLTELELLVEGAQGMATTTTSTHLGDVPIVNGDVIFIKDSEEPNLTEENSKKYSLKVQDASHSKSEETLDKNVCDLKNLLKKKDSEILTLNCQLESLIMQSEASTNYTLNKDSEIASLKLQIKSLTQEQGDNVSSVDLLEQLRKVETEKEQLVVILNEKTRECGTLKSEVHKLVNFVSAEKQALAKLQQDNQELMRKQSPDSGMSKEVIKNLSRIIKDKDIEMEALMQKVNTLVDIAQQEEPERAKVLKELLGDRENLSKQLKAYQADREQISLLLNQKHQESLRYHEEMQKMAVQLSTESKRYESLKEEHRSVSLLFEEKQKSLLNTQNEVVSLKQRVSELERQHTDLRQKYHGLAEHNSNNNQKNRENHSDSPETGADSGSMDLLLSEKDQMIYDLGQTLRKREDDSLQKDQALVSLQKRMDSVQFQFNETLSRLKESENECERLKLTWEQMKEEKSMLGETNRNLSMALQKAHTEQDAMRLKMGTLTQVMQTNIMNGSGEELAEMTMEKQISVLSGPQLLLERGEALEAQLKALGQERDQAQLALSQLQQENADVLQEKNQLLKQNEKLHRELDRLRTHLLELQDNFTQEVMVAEEREKELRIRLGQAEDKANLSSSAIISASQEASLRVESLQSQLGRVVRQRDAYLEQISQLEDRVQEQSAANTNLQLALEHLQTAHQREIQEKLQKQNLEMTSLVQQISSLKGALEHKETQLSDTSEALAAASRLSEQLDRKEETIGQLREEVSHAHREYQRLVQELKEVQTHTEGKVDKLIMKSLVLNYFMASPGQKPEVIRLLARILDFNQAEMQKAGIKMARESSVLWPGGGWLTNFINKPSSTDSPAHSGNAVATTSHNRTSQPSFSALFVQFLETESRPQAHLQLPIEQMTEGIVNRRGVRPDIFPHSHQLTPIKTITTTTTSTTTVLAEHPLMRPISTALPTFTPVIANEEEAKNSIVFLKDALQ